MTMPTDANLARAFWAQISMNGSCAFSDAVIHMADRFDAESPCSHSGYGTPNQPGPCDFAACPRRDK